MLFVYFGYYLLFLLYFCRKHKEVIMLTIGVAGGSGSGKTTIVKELVERLPKNLVSVISQDAYYYDNSDKTPDEKKQINFDHPDAIEWSLLVKHLDMLHKGESIPMPTYIYSTCTRSKDVIYVRPTEVIIVEGILVFNSEELCKRMDIKVFVDTDSDERLMRIIRRDIAERGRTWEDVLRHYQTFVKPMHQQFIEPTKRHADIILPQGSSPMAIDILASSVKTHLNMNK